MINPVPEWGYHLLLPVSLLYSFPVWRLPEYARLPIQAVPSLLQDQKTKVYPTYLAIVTTQDLPVYGVHIHRQTHRSSHSAPNGQTQYLLTTRRRFRYENLILPLVHQVIQHLSIAIFEQRHVLLSIR